MKPRTLTLLCALAIGWLCPPAHASPFEDRVRRFADPMATPTEADVTAVLKAGLDEHRGAEALAAVQSWLNNNPISGQDALFHAGRACEYSGQWPAAIGYYQRLLQSPRPDADMAGRAVDATYRLLLGAVGDEDAAYLFMRKDGNRLWSLGRARRYDRWFLDQARNRRDLPAVCDRLATVIPAASTEVAAYDDDLRWLCARLEEFKKEDPGVYEAAGRLAGVARIPPLAAARLRWVAAVMPYNFRLDALRNANAPADPGLTDPPMAAAAELLRLDPDRGPFVVADGWGVEYDHARSGNCAERFKVEAQRKLGQLLAAVTGMSALRRDDLLAYPIAQGRVRFDPEALRRVLLETPGIVNSLGTAAVPLFDKAATTVENARALAPQLARCPLPYAAIIRAVAAAGSLEFDAIIQPMLRSEAWRFGDNKAAVEWAFRWAAPRGAQLKDALARHSAPDPRFAELRGRIDKQASGQQRIAAFTALRDDLLSPAPSIPGGLLLWDQLFAAAPDADRVQMLRELIADLTGDREYLFRRALEASSFEGRFKLPWEPSPHITHFRFNRQHTSRAIADLVEPIQSALRKQAQAGDLSVPLFGAWLHNVDPTSDDARSFIKALAPSPAYAKLDPEYRSSAADQWHFGQLLWTADRAATDPGRVSSELLALPPKASPEAVEAALKAVVARAAALDRPVVVVGLDPVAGLAEWSPELRRLVLSLFSDNAPIGQYPARRGYEPLLVRLCADLQQGQLWGEIEPCLPGVWLAAAATDDERHYRAVESLAGLAQSALDQGQKSVALAVARSGSAGRAVRAMASVQSPVLAGLPSRIAQVEGKASIAIGIIDIPVDQRDPDYPIFRSQSEFAQGNTETAWELYHKNAERAQPMLRRLTVPYCLWLLQRELEAEQPARAEALVRAMTVWSREAPGAFTPTQDAELKLAYADAAFQRGELQAARAWYRRVADTEQFKGTPLQHKARLRSVNVDRAARDYSSAMEELDKLMLVRDEALRQQVHYARAEVLFDQRKHAEAFAEVSTVLRRDPAHADALILLGKVQLEMRKLVDASEIELGVSRDQKVIVPGETIKINLSDPALNVSGVGAEIEVEVRTGSGDVERVMLHQFGDDKTRFRAEVPTRLGARQPGDKVLELLGRDEIRYGYSQRFRARMSDLPPDPDTVITVASDARLQATAGAFPARQGERALDLAELGVSTAQQALGTRSVRPGNPIYVRVTDPDQSRTDQPDRVVVSVKTGSGDSIQRLVLTETGPHTGEFEAALPTARAQALAYASDSAPGRDANMVISDKPYPGWAGEIGSRADERMFVVDLNDNVRLGAMTVLCSDKSQAPTRFVVQTSMNGRDWITRARFPDDRAPWSGRPQVTAFPTYNLGIPVSRPVGRALPDDWRHGMEVASAREGVPYGAFTVKALSDLDLDLPSGGHPSYSVLLRYRALFYQPAAAIRTFRLEGFPAGTGQTVFLIDGLPAADDAADPLTIERELRPGLHELEIWRHEPRAELVRRKPRLLCDVAGRDAPAPCPDDMFDPDRFPQGVRQAIPAAAAVASPADTPDRFDIAFGDRGSARMVRLAIVNHRGPAPAIDKITLTDRDGVRRLPVEFDYQALRTNDRLEVLPGDTLSVRYEDDRVVTPRRGVQESRLAVAYNTATVSASSLNFVTTEQGRVFVPEPIRRFKLDGGIGIVINDPDMDVSAQADRVTYSVQVSDGGAATLEALETGPHTGEFLGRIFPVSAEPGRDGEVRVPEGGTLTAVYRDAENLDPGIPVDRTVTLEHARFAPPSLSVYGVTSEALPLPAPDRGVSRQADDVDRGGPEVVLPRRSLRYHYPVAGESPAAVPRVVIGAPLRFDVIAPHLALAASSEVAAYVQTESGRVAYRGQSPSASDVPFDVRVPGTLRLEAGPSRGPAVLPPPGYVADRGASPPTRLPPLDEGRFAFCVPVVLGDPPERSLATEDAVAARGSTTPQPLAVRPGDRVHIGFAYLDQRGDPRWLTASIDLDSHEFLDVMDGRYRRTVLTAYVGEKVYLRLIAPHRDLGPDRDVATVRLKTDSGVWAPYELRESEAHSGVFKASLTLGYAVQPAADGDTRPNPDGRDARPPTSLLLSGLPVKYGDRVTVSSEGGAPGESPSAAFAVNRGADGVVEPFSKRYDEDAEAIQTTFTLAECYFELAKHHRELDQESLARREMAHAQKLLAEAMETHHDPEMQSHAEYLLGNLAQEYADLSKNDESRKQMYLDALARFSRIPTDYPDSEFAPKAQFKKALVYERLGEVEIAVEEYVKLAYKYPDHELIPSVMSRLGAYFQDQGQALKKQAETIGGADAQAQANAETRGEALRLTELSRKQYLNAARVFKKLLERFPTDPLAGLAGLRSAQNFMRAGDFADAVDGFQKVYDNQEYDDKTIRSQAMYWAGISHERLGDLMAAYQLYRRTTFDFPDSVWAKQSRGRLADPAFARIIQEEELDRQRMLDALKEQAKKQ